MIPFFQDWAFKKRLVDIFSEWARWRRGIDINLDRFLTTGKDLESLLLNVSQEFDKMNSETVQSYDLSILLNDIREFKPPPPK